MNRKREAIFMGIGILTGLALSGPAVHAADYLTARPSNQAFYIDGQQTALTAYTIGGNNYVRLRDIGRAVNFGVIYDAATNSVHIDPDSPYIEEVTISAQTTVVPSALTEENVRAAILTLKEAYPHGAEYPAPYRPNTGLSRPFSNCDHCAGWAMLCSDVAFGNLPWRRIADPRWDDIRVGDLVAYDNDYSGHVVVVLDKTDEYIKVTESGLNNHARWGGQYFKWWLEEQLGYTLYTRYPQ